MNLLAIGDVIAAQGCDFLRQKLPAFKRWKQIDYCIANAENSAAGNGVTPFSAQSLLDSGVDFLTTGNHVYKRREVYDFLEENKNILRPANFCAQNPGKGFAKVDLGRTMLGVINLAGISFMDPVENPFRCVDALLEELRDCRMIVVDFHAEATSEKRALGFYLDGKVSALWGTHTHVQTADEQILPGGTGYITDLGMTGAKHSVLGVQPELSVSWLKTGLPTRFDTVTQGEFMLNGCIFELDAASGKTLSVERVNLT